MVVAHAFNPITQEAEAGARTGSKTTERNPISKEKKREKQTNQRLKKDAIFCLFLFVFVFQDRVSL